LPPTSGAESRLRTLAVVTRDRVPSLVACLTSYLTNAQQFGHAIEVLVADDAQGCSACIKTELKRLSVRFATPIRYAGRHEKRGFAEALATRSGVSPAVIDFALFGDPGCDRSTGANRNAVLLDTIDTRVFSVDDDTRCAAVVPPHASLFEPYASSAYDPTEFWFFPDRARLTRDVVFDVVDVFAEQDAWLGRPLADADGHVTLTLPGWLGDSAMASPRYYFSLTGPSRDRFMASESALLSREVLRCVRQPTIARTPFCMTTFFGMDNRELLPPFFPVQRNADGIFGLMLQGCDPGSRTAFLPWALLHVPEPARTFAPDDLWTDATSIRLCDLVIDAVMAHRWRADAVTPEARVADLGQHLGRLGVMRLRDYEERLRIMHELRRSAFEAVLERTLVSESSPDAWTDKALRLRQAMQVDVPLVPRDLPLEDVRAFSQSLIGRFGAVLEAWPALISAARQLRAEGVRLSRAV
jgi:hypothetical protein